MTRGMAFVFCDPFEFVFLRLSFILSVVVEENLINPLS